MTATIMLDAGTVRTGRRLLDPEVASGAPGPLADLDVCCASQVLESIILFDKIIVPDIDGSRFVELAEIVGSLGEASQAVHVSGPEIVASVTGSKQWLREVPDLCSLIETVGGTPVHHFVAGPDSEAQLVLSAFGVSKKYSARVARFLKVVAERDLAATANPQPTDPSEGTFSRRLRQLRGGESRRQEAEFELSLHRLGLPPMRVDWTQKIGLDNDPDLNQLATSLAWTGYRTRRYYDAATTRGIPYSPHPLRSRIAPLCFVSDTSPRPSKGPTLVRTYLQVLEQAYEQARVVANQRLRCSIAPLSFSPMLPYLARRAGKNRADLLPVTYEIRQKRTARSLRSAVSGLQEAMDGGDIATVMDAVHELDALSQEFRVKLGLEPAKRINVALLLAGMFQVEATGGPSPRVVRKIGKVARLRSPRILFLRDIFADLTQVARLGDIYDMFFTTPSA